MFSKKIRLPKRNKTISVATALVLMAIDDLVEDEYNQDKFVYGYQIMSHLKDEYNWEVKSGTVYPILKKLDKEFFIRKGVGPDLTNKRATIFYKITPKGKKLVKEIKALNDDSLEAALASSETIEENGDKIMEKAPFSPDNFAEGYLSPFLLDFCNKVAKSIALLENVDEFAEIQAEIENSLEKLSLCEKLLKNEIEKIETLKKL